ncbi:Serine/threonine protein kinase, partial [Globisporangium splendens]
MSSAAAPHRITISGRMSAKIYSGEIRSTSGDRPQGDAHRRVVVKAVPIAANEQQNDAADDVDLWREWRITKRLQALSGHQHVVELFEAYANKQSIFLVMEYCDQGDLLKYLMDLPNSRVRQEEAMQLLLQIARGLQYLHKHNIAHRDLSLENIFLHDGVCKIGDFGLSALADIPARDCVGKTQYVAPEAVLSQATGVTYDPVKADIWSLGVILFMMLTGSPLVDFASPLSQEFLAFKKVGVRGVLQAWKMESWFSFATLDLLSRMLQVDPRNRFQTTTELLNHPVLLAAAQRAKRV